MSNADAAQAATFRRPGADPFFLSGGKTGVLLVHGFTGVPGELKPLGQALAQAGYTVYAPLLPGHGGTPAGLRGLRWQQWAATANDGMEQLCATCDVVFVAGLSMGALLALHLAAQSPVAGVIAMSPALKLVGQRQLEWAGLAKHVMPWFSPLQRANFDDPTLRANIRQWVPDVNLDDPTVVAQIRREARLPVAALAELVQLQRQVRRELRGVNVPLLVMQGRKDLTVDLSGIDDLVTGIGSTDKHVVWFERSGHVLPQDAEGETVWATAARWLSERTIEPQRTQRTQRTDSKSL